MLQVSDYFSLTNSGGGTKVEGTLEIDRDGTYDVAAYAEAVVNTSGAVDRLQWKCDNVKSLENEFQNYSGTSLDEALRGLDTSKVTKMNNMFYNCSSLTSVPLFDTSSVDTASYMFGTCSSLTSIPSFNVSKVEFASYMFYNCRNLTAIPELDFTNATNLGNLFSGCTSLETVNIKTSSKLTKLESTFNNCTKLKTVPNLDTSNVTTLYSCFQYCKALTTIPELNTSKVTNIGYTFSGCTALKTITKLDMASVTNASNPFSSCAALENITLLNIKTSLQIGAMSSWGHLLTIDSLVNTCKECIQQSSALKLTVGTANLNKLSSVYVKLLEDDGSGKLPCEVCESTDERAMLIADYMGLKNWSLA